MAKDSIDIEWSPDLEQSIDFLSKVPFKAKQRIRGLTRDTLADMHNVAFDRAAKDTGYMRDHFFIFLDPDGMGGRLHGQAEYTAYLEYGTSRMPAQPAIRYAFTYHRVEYIKNLQKIVGEEFNVNVSGPL